MRMRSVQRSAVVGAAAAAALLAGAASAYATAGMGSAYGATVDIKLLGANAVKVGPFASANTKDGDGKSTFAGIDLPNILHTGVINAAASTDANSGDTKSSASIVDARVDLLKALGSSVSAKVIEADCVATPDGQKGSTKLVDLDLGKLGKVPVSPAANTVLSVGLGDLKVAKIVFNEQVHNADGSLTVNAIHVKLLGGIAGSIGSGDVVLSSATCAAGQAQTTTTTSQPTQVTTTTVAPQAPAQVIVPVGAAATGDGSEAVVVEN